jgi:hypothetical protein
MATEMTEQPHEDRTAEVFAVLAARTRGLERLSIAMGILLAVLFAALACAVTVVLQAALWGKVYAVLVGFSLAGGAGLGAISARALHKVLVRTRVALWREELKRSLGANDTDIDDALILLR